MFALLKSLNVVRLDDRDGKVRFAVTTTELDNRELNGFGKVVIRTFEQVAQEEFAPAKHPPGGVFDEKVSAKAAVGDWGRSPTFADKLDEAWAKAPPSPQPPESQLGSGYELSVPDHSAPDEERLAHAEGRLLKLDTLGVDALSPNDPIFALCGNDKVAAVKEAKKLVRNHIRFYRDRIVAAALAAKTPKVKRGRKPKPAAVETPETPATDAPPVHPDSAEADAKREADKAEKAQSAQDQQAELAAKLQAAQQQGFNW